MQRDYVVEEVSFQGFVGRTYPDGWRVIDVSHRFPEEGFTYSQLDAGECRAYVRVTEVRED